VLTGSSLINLHISGLLTPQLPSHFSRTSAHDILVVRRLASGQGMTDATPVPVGALPAATAPRAKCSGPPALRHFDTSPVGFAVFERVVLTVHPAR
jgi:magnesium transporter